MRMRYWLLIGLVAAGAMARLSAAQNLVLHLDGARMTDPKGGGIDMSSGTAPRSLIKSICRAPTLSATKRAT